MTAVANEIQLDEAAFRGAILRPGAPDYDVHRRIWNGSFDRRPAMIVRRRPYERTALCLLSDSLTEKRSASLRTTS